MHRLLIGFIALMMVASVVQAQEKIVDSSEAEASALVLISGNLTVNSPTYNRTVGGGTFAPNCDLNPGLSGVGTAVYYDVHCFESTDTQPIEIIVDDVATTIGDTHMVIYCDPFNPNSPADNVVSIDDDGGVGLYSAFTLADNIVLTPGVDHYLVLGTFGNDDTGYYEINTSANVQLCGAVPVESSSWGSIKALYE